MEAPPIRPWRVHLLRLAFAVMGVGLAVTQWPLLAAIGPSYAHLNAVVICLFSALGLMALGGIFKPLDMLPILLFEIAWKVLWLALVGVPAWLAGNADPAVATSLVEVGLIIVFMPLVPWDYVFRRYLRSERRAAAASSGRSTVANIGE